MIRAYDEYGNVIELAEWEKQIRTDVIDEILERLEELHERYINQYGAVGGNPMAFATKQCKQIVQDVQEVAEEYKNGWISVSERLPEEGEDVLVWYEYFRYGNFNCMWQTYGIGYHYGGHWSGDVTGTNAKCIAWMPLPESYRENDKVE